MDDKKKNERLSLLSDLIKMAKADKDDSTIEFDFLLNLALQMGVSKEDFKILFEEYIAFHPPVLEHDRIIQFQRLVLMMNVDQHVAKEELDYIRELGMKMGLHPSATDEVLKIMGDFPNSIVPPEKLIKIFKTFHN
jgi:uncharacterized tellurite resistance protein B-like protein